MKYLLFFCTVFISCTRPIKNVSKFNLYTDYSDFSKKMENGDTVKLLVDLSACLSQSSSISYLFKRDNQVYISTKIETVDLGKSIQELEQTPYSVIKSDSLNFENYFSFLSKKNRIRERENEKTAAIRIFYKQDTLCFNSNNLSDHLKNIDYFLRILKRVYPNCKI